MGFFLEVIRMTSHLSALNSMVSICHLADSIAKLSQGRKDWYICREGIPMDDNPGEKCEPVIWWWCCSIGIRESSRIQWSVH